MAHTIALRLLLAEVKLQYLDCVNAHSTLSELEEIMLVVGGLMRSRLRS